MARRDVTKAAYRSRLRQPVHASGPVNDRLAPKPAARLAGRISAVIYVLLIVTALVCGHCGNVQDAAFLRHIDARPWVVPEDESGEGLDASVSTAGVFALYWAPEESLDISVVCLGLVFLAMYLLIAWALPGLWIALLPLAIGSLLFGAIDVMAIGAVFFGQSGVTTPIVQIDPFRRVIISDNGQSLALCAGGIRTLPTSFGRTQNVEVELLEAGKMEVAAMFATDDPAQALAALIRRDAAAAGCAIPDHAAWPGG